MLLTRSPLIHGASTASSFDLHVLSTPPAFVLSQDQTLRKRIHQHPTPQKEAQGANKPYETNNPSRCTPKRAHTNHKKLASITTNTLLSSQTTNAHLQDPDSRILLGATALPYRSLLFESTWLVGPDRDPTPPNLTRATAIRLDDQLGPAWLICSVCGPAT